MILEWLGIRRGGRMYWKPHSYYLYTQSVSVFMSKNINKLSLDPVFECPTIIHLNKHPFLFLRIIFDKHLIPDNHLVFELQWPTSGLTSVFLHVAWPLLFLCIGDISHSVYGDEESSKLISAGIQAIHQIEGYELVQRESRLFVFFYEWILKDPDSKPSSVSQTVISKVSPQT